MSPDRIQKTGKQSLSQQRGATIVAAIFLLLLLAGLGALMVTMTSVQNTTSAQDIQGARAYQAARAGLEWGIYQLQVADSCASSATKTFGGTLSAFSVEVACAHAGASPYDEAGSAVKVHRIRSKAVLAGSAVGAAGYVERELQAVLEK